LEDELITDPERFSEIEVSGSDFGINCGCGHMYASLVDAVEHNSICSYEPNPPTTERMPVVETDEELSHE
jgi:hypothetical protein